MAYPFPRDYSGGRAVRLLIVMWDFSRADAVCTCLYSCLEQVEAVCCGNADQAILQLRAEEYDLLLLGLGDGEDRLLLRWLAEGGTLCPPRVLLLAETGDAAADRTVPPTTGPEQLCPLLLALDKKPLPGLAKQLEQRIVSAVVRLLDDLAMPPFLKGRRYAQWLLERIVPSRQADELPVGEWYRQCALAFHTTPAAVERCLRGAVETVFTQGSMQAIERCFGTTVDPEKGKPTNRLFLLKAADHLRKSHYSLTDTRSLNSSEMHQRPAAPTSV